MSQQVWHRGRVTVLSLIMIGLTCACIWTSVHWIGRPFPGFLVLANRVIASVSLMHWSVASHGHIYQHTIVAVNAQPVQTAEEIYAAVRRLPPGQSITYSLEKDGRTSHITLASQVFRFKDYILLFGAYLFSGLSAALIGLGVWFLQPAAAASRALLMLGLFSGLWALTAVDLYSPYQFFRLHVLGEAFLGAGFLHLATVFPSDRFRRARTGLLWGAYLIAGGLGIGYEISLYQPNFYSIIHGLCMAFAGCSALALLGKTIWDYWVTSSYLVRERIRVVGVGFLAGYGFPAVMAFAAGITGGEVPMNYAAFTAPVFPLSIGYAIVKHDLFEIDAMLKRGAYYLLLTTVVTVCYIVFLEVVNLTLQSWDLLPFLLPLFVMLVLHMVRNRIQDMVDRVFFRLAYDPEKVLGKMSASLAASLHLNEIFSLIWNTLGETVGVQRGAILLQGQQRNTYLRTYPEQADEEILHLSDDVMLALKQNKKTLTRDTAPEDIRGSSSEDCSHVFDQLACQLIVSLVVKDELIGILALGQKESGEHFSSEDLRFLSTLANQAALSIANARAYQEVELLNGDLEKKVAERTQELARTNEELQGSFKQLEETYRDLQHSQESLVHAEKMAAFGRMTAGIAHEMNTPLGSALNSIDLLQELIDEYRRSVGNPQVNEQDHREIASEMDTYLSDTQKWIRKATQHIRSLKMHARSQSEGEEHSFSVLQVMEEVTLLLEHRLRLAQCHLKVQCTAAQPDLYGDPSKLSQVLINLIVNACDAYRATGSEGGEIRVDIAGGENSLEIQVRDYGCGIEQETCEKIFEEFFSTKPLGEGTGLGLPISREIIVSAFGGELEVESTLGEGTTFICRLPQKSGIEQEQPTASRPLSQEEVSF